jgi:hypothetical protein
LSTFSHFTFVIPGLLSFCFIGCKEYSKSIDNLWEKVDKEWYEVILRENIGSIKHKLVTGDIPIGENILKICEIMKSASITSSSNKVIFKAKPKLKAVVSY